MRFRLSGSLNYHKKERLFCNSCHMEIIEPQDLQEHFVQDENTGKYTCQKCKNGFSNFIKLVQHNLI